MFWMPPTSCSLLESPGLLTSVFLCCSEYLSPARVSESEGGPCAQTEEVKEAVVVREEGLRPACVFL